MSDRRAVDEQRFKNFFESAAAAEDAGFYGADAAFENFGDLFVAKAFDIAEDDGTAKNVGNVIERALHGDLNFVRGELFKRSGAEIFDFHLRATFGGFGIDGNIFLRMTLEPALVIESFANGDAIEPGLQRAALAEIANSAKRFQENFLSAVGGIGGISEHAEDEAIDRSVVMRDEPVEGSLRAGLQLVDEIGFIAAPREGTSPIGH